MLARLEQINGVVSAEADHSGRFFRIRAGDPSAIEAARDALQQLGYDAAAVDEPAANLRWFRGDTARDLSREAAQIIADRVIAAYAHAHKVAQAGLASLTEAVASALYAAFASVSVTALGTQELRSAAETRRALYARAAEDAARALVGSDAAQEIGSLLLRELDRMEGAPTS